MNYRIDTDLATPAYLQLYDQLKEAIVRGAFPYGTRLPSKRSLAAETSVSVITVEHAYALLREEGFVQSRERSGFTVTFRTDDGFVTAKDPVHNRFPASNAQTKDSSATLSNTSHMGVKTSASSATASGNRTPSDTASITRTPSTMESNTHTPSDVGPGAHTLSDDAPAFPFSVIAKTTRRVLADYGEATLERSPNMGCVRLREAIQRYLASNQGIYVDIDQIVIGSGAEYLYSLVVDLLGRQRVFALESPSYEKIEQVYTALGVSCELLPLASDGIQSEALAATHADVLHITPYRSFPTGITAPLYKRLEYVSWAESGERFIVEDDFESEFSVAGKPTESVFVLSPRDNVIYLNTFSKTISPALRVGYMVLPSTLARTFSERLGFLSCTVPTFDQLVVAELLSNGDFERHINRVRRAKRKELFARKKA
jgi:GntR family transcriptional regulator/MocR family aminotransferase